MPRIKLTVAYDGTEFCGWASQAGRRTVHGTLSETIFKVSGQSVDLIGASRTDSGAHARGQVCHFDSEVNIPAEKWPYILNRALPADLAVQRSAEVSPEFNSRFSACDRWYRYRIATGTRDPFQSRFSHDYYRPLDVNTMMEAAQHLVGEHDFLAFTEELDPAIENTRRELYRVVVSAVKNEIRIDIVGTAFLRGMMRRMSGALLEVGRGYRPVVDISRLLSSERDQLDWPVVLPAKGLCLMKVRYGRYPRDNRRKEA